MKPAKPVYTVAQFVGSVYFPVSRRRWKASTTMTTEAVIRAHLLPELGPRLLEKVTREELQALLDVKAAAGLSRSVVEHLRWQMRAIFRLAMGDGAIPFDPTQGLSTPRCGKKPSEKRVMSHEDVYRAMNVLPIREKLIFRLATIEGMRPGEILGLQIRDLSDQSAKVSRRVYRGDVDTPKNGKSREVALSPGTSTLLREWLNLLPHHRPEAWLFPSENPEKSLMRDNVQRRSIQPKLAQIDLGWVTFQVMRRTNASLAHERRIDLKVAADQRGHGLGVAMEVYTHAGLEQKLEAVRDLDSAVVQGVKCLTQ
jgi:integrase